MTRAEACVVSQAATSQRGPASQPYLTLAKMNSEIPAATTMLTTTATETTPLTSVLTATTTSVPTATTTTVKT